VSTAVHPAAPAAGAATASPALAVGCLGRLRISADGVQLHWRPVRRGRAVFQYLLAHRRRSVARDELAEVFRPGSSAGAARNCLNTSLSILRSSLRDVLGDLPVVVYRDGAYCIDPALDLTVDAEELESLVAEGARRRRAGDVEGAARALREAVALYRGDLFEDDPYEEWLQQRRRELREAHLGLLEQLGRSYLVRGDHTACAKACRAVLDVEPEREAVHRVLMRSYALQGRRHLALRQLERCRSALWTGVGAAPDQETLALVDRIRRGDRLTARD
jgi:DNA-binding SARP family transcriptional activator